MSEDLLNRLQKTKRLPSPPGVVVRILEIVDSDDASIEDLSTVISSDPALSAMILKYVRSPLLGLAFHGTTLQEAVSRIGMRGTSMLALSFMLVSQRHRQACPSFDFDAFWSESLARAVAARHLAKTLRGNDPDELFIAGLLLRIGKMVLATAMPAEYDPIVSGAKDASDLEVREREALGCDHVAVGRGLLEAWHLPEGIVTLIGQFAEGSESLRPEILRAADMVARFMVHEAEQDFDGMETLAQLVVDRVGIEADSVLETMRTIATDWSSFGQLLSVPTSRPPDFDALQREADERRAMIQLANEIEMQELREKNAQLANLATHDGLTGLLNRNAFNEALPEAVAAAEKDSSTLALLLVDIDHFKAINDTAGHRAGDAVLEQVARVLDDNARKRDSVFRYGGEEFAVLAPDCSREGAEAIAEGIRKSIEQVEFLIGGTGYEVTVSVGVAWAQWPDAPRSGEELVTFADRCLYAAKHAGRNCWRSVPEDSGEPRRRSLFARLGRMFAG
ncbi:MAG: GGDEF domain-containing protein [Verrucomicrobia bacterium]|nr:MAG: GGDEF domain-containing protein [Verrucomicrobiota bacterium]